MKRKQKQARMVGQSSTIADLPSHIVMEIISTLPIKSVMAIRCVCKSLLSVVSDSHFQMMHSTRAPTELLVTHTGKSTTTLCIAEYVFEDDSLTAVDDKSNVVFEFPKHCVDLVNSCCGLVCYKGGPRNMFVVICNPFTRECIRFPCPARMDKTVEKGIGYGLGFSPKANCFKLLRIIYHKKVGTDYVDEESRMVGEIYTFGERVSSWKRVANRPHAYLSWVRLREVIFHEGALHWYCTSDDAIVTFDFDTELFGKLVTPPCMGDMRWYCTKVRWSLALGVFENCLCISGHVGDCVDIWALKEYGQGSWVKIFSIQKDVNRSIYEPVHYLQNGEVLMLKNHAGIVCFNPDTGTVKKVSGMYYHDGAVLIRPSLASLKILLGDNVKVHSVKPWYRRKAATIPPSSSPGSSEALASTSHPSEVKEGCADVESFASQDPRPSKDRRAGQSSSEIQKLADEIETLKEEDKRKGKAIAKLKKRKKKDSAFMRFMYQQMLNVNPNMPSCPISDDSCSSDDSD